MADIIDSVKDFIKDTYEIKASITGDLCIIEYPRKTQSQRLDPLEHAMRLSMMVIMQRLNILGGQKKIKY
jgi:hypothetical protein